MNTALELINYLNLNILNINNINTNNPYIEINGIKIIFDINKNTYFCDKLLCTNKRIMDLTKFENHSVVMLLIKLFKKGYSPNVISLEQHWQLGHNNGGSLDIMLKNPLNNDIYMFEVKSCYEIYKYTNIDNSKKIKQLFSYAIQEKTTKIISFYSYNFDNQQDIFFNINIENILHNAINIDDLFDKWNKYFDTHDYINNNNIFNIKSQIKKYEDLQIIANKDIHIVFNQFLTILRLHAVSDKSNAFTKLINLFLAKFYDETTENKQYQIKDINLNIHFCTGLKFQYIDNIDTHQSFIQRLNELYKYGMLEYLKKDILYYDSAFAFIEIIDDTSFCQNCEIVKDVVKLLENYKFAYNAQCKFLGDFFEELLHTSFKQEAGQFFTPFPIVNFIINSLPFKQTIINNLINGKYNFIPSVIDYACGAGHFLISSISKIQSTIEEIYNQEYIKCTNMQINKISSYVLNKYLFVDEENCVGIEKDHRLAKTAKIAMLLNGINSSNIICGDGINKFSSKEYKQTVLYSEYNKIEKFDFLISNPPYSVDGFMYNFVKNNININSNDFSLLKKINYKDSAIETFFIERAEQLIKHNGYAVIILPQSILSNAKYENMRRFILSNFSIKCMVMLAEYTFQCTSTSPVILFLKKEKQANQHYKTLLIYSPKYLSCLNKQKQEIEFLGYKFSTNRTKQGIEIYNTSTLKNISHIVNEFIINNNCVIDNLYKDNIKVKYLNDILLNQTNNYIGDIYPKYNKHIGIPLNQYCKINNRTSKDFIVLPEKYIEISNLSQTHFFKNKQSSRFCKKGDILIASIYPKKTHIVIADNNYMLSPAIHVLSHFNNINDRDYVFKKLQQDCVLQQIHSLLDGFKITYAKISEQNLINNILI